MRVHGVLGALVWLVGCASAVDPPGGSRDGSALDARTAPDGAAASDSPPARGDDATLDPDGPSSDGAAHDAVADTTGALQPFSIGEAARECELQFACGHAGLVIPLEDQGDSFGTCVEGAFHDWAVRRRLGLGFDARAACLAAAHDCASYWRCVSPGHDPAYCASHPGVSCDGATWVDCSVGIPLVVDCGAFGARCTPSRGPSRCTLGEDCGQDAGTSTMCTGSVARQCDRRTGLVGVYDCATEPVQRRCTGAPLVWTDGLPACDYPLAGGPCHTDEAPSCDGAVAYTCSPDGTRTDAVDCSLIGAACTTETRVIEQACELRTGAACDRDQQDAVCDGTTISACVLGRVVPVDCRAIGMRTCAAEPVPDWYPARSLAFCVP